jgi:hypothetical protein
MDVPDSTAGNNPAPGEFLNSTKRLAVASHSVVDGLQLQMLPAYFTLPRHIRFSKA